MNQCRKPGIEFVVDSNVHIEIVSPQKVVCQTVDKHNKATKRLVEGLLRFIRGEFNTTYRRTDESEIVYLSQAKNYIPCFINIGTGGIRLNSNGFPDIDTESPRTPPMEELLGSKIPWWDADTNYVKFTDMQLYLEQLVVSREEIKAIAQDEAATNIAQVGDIEQIIFSVEVPPGKFNQIYKGETKDIFITELGLYASGVPGEKDLLARVILKNQYERDSNGNIVINSETDKATPTGETQILYVRPQDTILLKWTISIVALDDTSMVDEDTQITTDSGINDLSAGSLVNDVVPYDGTIEYIDDSSSTD